MTGATGTLGARLLNKFLDQSFDIVAVGRHAPVQSVTFVEADFTDDASVTNACTALECHEAFDVVCLCSGIDCRLNVCAIEPVSFHKVMQVNCFGPMKILTTLRLNPNSRILACSSILVENHQIAAGIYASSKSALETLLNCYSVERLDRSPHVYLLRLPDWGINMREAAGSLDSRRTEQHSSTVMDSIVDETFHLIGPVNRNGGLTHVVHYCEPGACNGIH